MDDDGEVYLADDGAVSMDEDDALMSDTESIQDEDHGEKWVIFSNVKSHGLQFKR